MSRQKAQQGICILKWCYRVRYEKKKQSIPTKVALFDGNMLFLMQKSMARYVFWIIWTVTACCTAAATSLTQDRMSPSWIPIKVYHHRGFLRSSKAQFVSDCLKIPSSFSFCTMALLTRFWSPEKEKLQLRYCCRGSRKVSSSWFPVWARCSMAFPPAMLWHSGCFLRDSLRAT